MAFVFVATAFCSIFLSTEATTSFRGNLRQANTSTQDLKAEVLEAILAMGGRLSEGRLGDLEGVMRPTFDAMPKNSAGNLEHAAASYVLHRLFVQRHGMYIKGLEPAGAGFQRSSATEVLQDRVPTFVQSLFEERLKGQGLSLHELAVLAATLEHLISKEAIARLKLAYAAENFSEAERISTQDVDELLDTYMTMILVGTSNKQDLLEDKAKLFSGYQFWNETQTFARQVRSSVAGSREAEEPFVEGISFEGMRQIVEEIGERYGRWQDAECQDLKRALMKKEHRGTGRVLLKDFYSEGLKGQWQFSESVEYLRELGALHAGESVFIANYVNAHSNCLSSSGLYSICCINECESLLGHLEAKIAQPEAEVETLLALVSALPSATTPAPAIAGDLRRRLEDIARLHGGLVPIHGRLFAQWLHHVYPRECPFPHAAGRTNPMTADDWLSEKGSVVSATTEEMLEISMNASAAVLDLPHWTEEEELLVKPKAQMSLLPKLGIAFALGCLAQLAAKASKKQVLLPMTQKEHFC
ncbi:unnamed protein product [Effrenium voratum]|uniref:Uncharacterized protein n=1 Tax=Effrenium voratum TaxID=2562239 RepID=A0AA36IL27_9DINO|nr:unnamed protein product [Effrenium voratum]